MAVFADAEEVYRYLAGIFLGLTPFGGHTVRRLVPSE